MAGKPRQLVFLITARLQLLELLDRILAEDPAKAQEIIDALEATLRRRARTPFIGRSLHPNTGFDFRVASAGRFKNICVVYEVTAAHVIVCAAYHGRMSASTRRRRMTKGLKEARRRGL